MIDRFNFYDLYGYVLPGAMLLALALMPASLATGTLPDLEWGSTLAFLLAGYVVGHLLQAMTRSELPSTVRDRYPSDFLLDEADDTFPAIVKQRLSRAIYLHFALDTADPPQRQAAFELCRQHLQANGRPSYAEQFQGLYAFMRGVQAVAMIAAAEFIGWVFGNAIGAGWWWTARMFAAGVGALWLLAVVIEPNVRWVSALVRHTVRNAFRAFVGLAAALGLLAGTVIPLTPGRRFVLLLVTAALIATIRIASRAQEVFAIRFAATVYQAFLVRSWPPRPVD